MNRLRMVALLDRLVRVEGMSSSTLDGVGFLRANRSYERTPVMYEPCIVILAQGCKRGFIADQTFMYDPLNYLVLTIPLPFECETEAPAVGPVLGVSVRVDLATVGELVMKMETRGRLVGTSDLSAESTPMDAALSDATVRLLECLDSSIDTAVLGPQIVREIVYRVLCGARGDALKSLLMMDGARTQIHRLLHRIHAEYASDMDVAALADEAGMSVSALHHHFKAITATSPLQYLKTVRLHKARMFMVQDSMGASVAAEKVGYESQSQFSREFKRLFRDTPVGEATRLRAHLGFIESPAG